MSGDTVEEFEKGINYLKGFGTYLILQLPALKLDSNGKPVLDSEGKPQFDPKGKPKSIPVGSGFVFDPNQKEFERPFKKDYPDGRSFQMTTRFMDAFEIKRDSDLMRMIRNCSIILTNFTGPVEQDNFGVHLERLRNWIGKGNWEKGIKGLVTVLPIIQVLMGSKTPQFETEEYSDAAIVLAMHFGLW